VHVFGRSVEVSSSPQALDPEPEPDEWLPIDDQGVPWQVQESDRALLVRVLDGDRRGHGTLWDGETTLSITGPKPPYEQARSAQKYS